MHPVSYEVLRAVNFQISVFVRRVVWYVCIGILDESASPVFRLEGCAALERRRRAVSKPVRGSGLRLGRFVNRKPRGKDREGR